MEIHDNSQGTRIGIVKGKDTFGFENCVVGGCDAALRGKLCYFIHGGSID
jgi:hypothetical protein